jgi:NAD(P)-dependent dehydrogenase (short-subunit alcohol dehydrogenase family)
MVTSIAGKTAVVTGASSGIGKTLALRLSAAGARVALVARDGKKLEAAAQLARGEALCFPCDLAVDAQIRSLADALIRQCDRLDILIHCAGAFACSRHEDASAIGDFELLLQVNVRAPYALTHLLLPRLKVAQGQVVFINSTVTRSAALAGRGQFAATQHALRTMADALRDEVNCEGVRVISVFPGSTATPRQARMHSDAGQAYAPERLLQPDDVADLTLAALQLSRTAEATDLYIRPMLK